METWVTFNVIFLRSILFFPYIVIKGAKFSYQLATHCIIFIVRKHEDILFMGGVKLRVDAFL